MIMPEKDPLISCLCLSYKRHEFLHVAIQCFISQTYPNKELIVIGHDDDEMTGKMALTHAAFGVRYFSVPRATIGTLRNMSIRKSSGEYFCQWDDDDWHHSMRLEMQMKEIYRTAKDANILAYWLMFDKENEQAYLSYPLMWPGTILCNRKLFDEGQRYPDLEKSEDSNFMTGLFWKNCMSPLIMPSLYIYVYHGKNTWDASHFEKLFKGAQKLSRETSRLIASIIKNEHSPEVSSKLISKAAVLREFDYFKAWKEDRDPLQS
jgi:glycosyltransferase involved in cell wall biosynthesis